MSSRVVLKLSDAISLEGIIAVMLAALLAGTADLRMKVGKLCQWKEDVQRRIDNDRN